MLILSKRPAVFIVIAAPELMCFFDAQQEFCGNIHYHGEMMK
jgi:hypothetical protein